MEAPRSFLVFGILLLAIAALLGFVQGWHSDRPATAASWRVVHSGGTAGAVQLLALSAVWHRLGTGAAWTIFLAWGLIFATWAFFVGPLARALGWPRLARVINVVGAVVALPAYVALPIVVMS